MEDYAAMIGRLQRRMSREEIATAIGVEAQEVDAIASGYVPDEEIGERLRELAVSGATRITRIPAKAIVIFVIVDALVFAGVAAYVVLR